jgi:hypothetical protein
LVFRLAVFRFAVFRFAFFFAFFLAMPTPIGVVAPNP